jgi:hypothetical protein
VGEIQRAIPSVKVASFVPVIAYDQPSGLLTIISGKLSESGLAAVKATETDLPDVKSLIGTARLGTRLDLDGSYFTLAVAADNLTLPAANAILLASAVLMGAKS